MKRRTFLKAALGAATLPLPGCGRAEDVPRFDSRAFPAIEPGGVAVLPAADYGRGLEDVVRRGLGLFDVPLRGRRVVLKPNFVEFDSKGVINTHPALIAATVDVLLSADVAEVVIAEGPGHRRDNEYIVTASGLWDVLRERSVRYVDLNFDEVRRIALRSRFTSFGELYLPRTVLDADLFVSMPKLKTHHWAGATLTMKNLFGVVPGSIYGWPKNALHWAGIDESVVDLTATLPAPRFAIVDGIVGMEGNGPIQGDAREMGVVVFGDGFPQVDATCARLMGLRPEAIRYLAWAGEFLGGIREDQIEQLGEDPERLRKDFRVLPHFAHLRA